MDSLVDFKGLRRVFVVISAVGVIGLVGWGVWQKLIVKRPSVFVVSRGSRGGGAGSASQARQLLGKKVTAFASFPGGSGSWFIGTEDGLYVRRWNNKVEKIALIPMKGKVRVEKIKILNGDKPVVFVSFKENVKIDPNARIGGPGPSWLPSRLLYSYNEGYTWTVPVPNLSTMYVRDVVIDRQNKGVMVVSDYGALISTNRGGRWKSLVGLPRSSHKSAFLTSGYLDIGNKTVWLGGVGSYFLGRRVDTDWSQDDYRRFKWRWFSYKDFVVRLAGVDCKREVLPNNESLCRYYYVRSIGIDPNNSGHIMVNVGNYASSGRGIGFYESKDNGASWRYVGEVVNDVFKYMFGGNESMSNVYPGKVVPASPAPTRAKKPTPTLTPVPTRVVRRPTPTPPRRGFYFIGRPSCRFIKRGGGYYQARVVFRTSQWNPTYVIKASGRGRLYRLGSIYWRNRSLNRVSFSRGVRLAGPGWYSVWVEAWNRGRRVKTSARVSCFAR
ncbi:MAG: hypothetical protein GXP43_02515 [bacterium]|nr:hypothetical protein [bacterium]